jgi:hypothetical protein
MTTAVRFHHRWWHPTSDPEDADALALQLYLTGSEVRQDLLARNLPAASVTTLLEDHSIQADDLVLSSRQEPGFLTSDVVTALLCPQPRFSYDWGENRLIRGSNGPVRVTGSLFVPRLPPLPRGTCTADDFVTRDMEAFLTHLWANPTHDRDYNRYGRRWEGYFYQYLFDFGNRGTQNSVARVRQIQNYFMFGVDLREPRVFSPVTLRGVERTTACQACGLRRQLSVRFVELCLDVGCECAVKLYLLSQVMPLIAQTRLAFQRSGLTRAELLAVWGQLCYWEQQVAKHMSHVERRYGGGRWWNYGCP